MTRSFIPATASGTRPAASIVVYGAKQAALAFSLRRPKTYFFDFSFTEGLETPACGGRGRDWSNRGPPRQQEETRQSQDSRGYYRDRDAPNHSILRGIGFAAALQRAEHLQRQYKAAPTCCRWKTFTFLDPSSPRSSSGIPPLDDGPVLSSRVSME